MLSVLVGGIKTMRAVTLLAMWFTVYGNINKTYAMICNYYV